MNLKISNLIYYKLLSILFTVNLTIFSAAKIESEETKKVRTPQELGRELAHAFQAKMAIKQLQRPELAKDIKKKENEIEQLISEGADVNVTIDDYRFSPIIFAIISGDEEDVTSLIHAKANINFTVDSLGGSTPLILASNAGKTRIVKLLLEAGADINAINDNKINALMAAAQSNRIKTVKLLLTYGAKLDQIDDQKNGVMFYARNFPEIIKLLIYEQSRRNGRLDAWKNRFVEKIKETGILIPPLVNIISEYLTPDKYEDLPLWFRLKN